MSQRVLAADNEAILAAEIEVINPTTQHLRTFLPVIGDGSGETVVVGSQITVTSTSTGRTKVVDHVGHDVAVVEPRGSKQFIAVEFPGYGWHHMDLPVNYPASRVTGGGAGGGVTLPILESDVTNLPTDLAGKAATVHTHAAADVASGTLASARLPVATTVAMGATEVDNNSAGSPVALTASGHGSAADPHPQYALDTEKGAVSGIATLDGAGKLASSQLPLGTSASTAAAGNDSRLSDNRTPLAHKASHQSGGSDELSVAGLLGVLANPQPPVIGSTSTTAVAGNDSRLSDARTPLAHTHAASDVVSGVLAMARLATGTPDGTKFVRDDGTLATPAGGSSADTFVVNGSDQANSTTTAAAVTGLSHTVAAGTYLIKYWIVFRSAATTTGIQMFLKHGGTTTRLAGTWYTLTTGTTATSGIADQATTTTAQMMEGKGQRASNVASGAMAGVDTAAADQFAVFEALAIVTVSGTLDLMFNSSVAGSAVTMMTGTTLALTKVA